MKPLSLHLEDRRYPIYISRGCVEFLPQFLLNAGYASTNLCIVTQKQIAKHHLPTLLQSLKRAKFEVSVFYPPSADSSEACKSAHIYLKLIDFMAKHCSTKKKPVVLAFGGGVIGDLAGFAASTYRRGVPFVQIPTTITAQVDSSIGGKNGVDLSAGKNLLGTIYQPQAVFSDLNMLQTLSQRHWSDGFAEIIKYAIIQDSKLLSLLESNSLKSFRADAKRLEQVISICSLIKSKIVEKDEMDTKGLRMVLNFGHTTGHAIEAAQGYRNQYTHGEAIGLGMLVASELSEALGLLKNNTVQSRIRSLLTRYKLPTWIKNVSVGTILEKMNADKKFGNGKNKFILLERLHRTRIISDVDDRLIQKAVLKFSR